MKMIEKFTFVVIILAVIVEVTWGQDCTTAASCNDCIRRLDCAWCNNYEFEAPGHPLKDTPRCNTIKAHVAKTPLCGLKYLEYPTSYKINSLRLQPVSPGKVHISPQNAKVNLAFGQPIELTLTYLEASDKPLDLYYIIDLSATMEDNKKQVAQQGETLALELKKLTKDVRMGFGSFIDKPIVPFSSDQQIKGTSGSGNVPPYGFKNDLTLTADTNAFVNAVNDAKISENWDYPEGSLDAIVQAAVCQDKIGWRNESRKLIVLATDGEFHIAGDGRLAGIVKPNDLKCHLNNENLYTHSTLLDYPSVGQVSYVLGRNQIYTIFAVTEDVFSLYVSLTKKLSGSKAAQLEAKSSNVVNLIKDEYKRIQSRVELIHSGGPSEDILDIKYKVDCTGNKVFKRGQTCRSINPGGKIEFKITLTLKRCPDGKSKDEQLTFTTFDLSTKEGYVIDLTFACHCNCSSKDNLIIKDASILSDICSSNAKQLECGKCVCKDTHAGANCECSKLGDDDDVESNKKCIDERGLECSGRGKCECGICSCPKDFSGKFCECEDSKCRHMSSDVECFGRGTCACGKCQCADDAGGEHCQCSKNMTTCIEPQLGKLDVCNGKGDCRCQSRSSENFEWECSCFDAGYSGQYCQTCRTCPMQKQATRCNEPGLAECARCHLMQHLKNTTKITECSACSRQTSGENDISDYKVTVLNGISDQNSESDETVCSFQYDEKCNSRLAYSYLRGSERLKLKVKVDALLVCLKEPPFLWYIVGVMGSILLIGLLTLILWKLITHFHDKRDFEKFEKERAETRFDAGENPLYNTPMSEFVNPSYTG